MIVSSFDPGPNLAITLFGIDVAAFWCLFILLVTCQQAFSGVLGDFGCKSASSAFLLTNHILLVLVFLPSIIFCLVYTYVYIYIYLNFLDSCILNAFLVSYAWNLKFYVIIRVHHFALTMHNVEHASLGLHANSTTQWEHSVTVHLRLLSPICQWHPTQWVRQ